jgi:hypothetical protein
MVPALAADSLGQMMLKIEVERRLRAANDPAGRPSARATERINLSY